MANVSRVRGFVPVRHLDGSPWNGQTETFLVDSGDGTAMFIGDAVKLAGSAGVAGQVVFGQNVEGMATITRCASGSSEAALVGVVIGFSPDPNNLMKKHRAASESRLAYVVTDPTVVFEIQEDGVGGNVVAADIGLAGVFTVTAGSTVTGLSGMAYDSSQTTGTGTFPLKLIGLSRRADNAFGLSTTDLAKVEVVLNVSVRLMQTAGA